MSTIPQNHELIKELVASLEAHRGVFKQHRFILRAVALVFAEISTFGRLTTTQLMMRLGLTDAGWTIWHRLFSRKHFDAERARAVMLTEVLQHVGTDVLFLVPGDATQTPRSSCKTEGADRLRYLRTSPLIWGIHAPQRWFHNCWLLPP